MKLRNIHRSILLQPRRSGLALAGVAATTLFFTASSMAADLVQNVTFAAPADIDPLMDGSRDVTLDATDSTPQATLEALPGFRVIQNFAAAGNQSLVDAWILNANDAPTTPDLRITYSGNPSANAFQVGSNISFQTSLGSSIRLQGATLTSNTGLKIEAGSWDDVSFTNGGVAALGFTVVGPIDRAVGDSVTVVYYDTDGAVLSTQVITSSVAAAAYTGHQATGGKLISHATVTLIGDNVSPASILAIDDIGFAPDPAAAIAPLKWRVGSGDWDTANTNWQPLAGGSPAKYVEGADVTFDDSASGAGPISVSLVNTRSPASITSSGGKDYILSDGGGVLEGGGSLTVNGPGTLTLATDNFLTGPTTLADGTLRLASPGAVQDSTVTITGGSLVFATSGGESFTLGGLAGGFGYDIPLENEAGDAVTLTVGRNGSATTYAGGLSGPGSLVKTGSGSLTLSGPGGMEGDTFLEGFGILRIAHAEALGTTGEVFLNSSQTGAGLTTFEINGGIEFSLPITVDSTTGREHFTSTGGANTLASTVSIAEGGTNTMSFDAAGGAGNLFTVSGGISAPDFIGILALRGTSGGLISSQINAPNATLELIQNAANVVWTISSTGNTWATTRMAMGANGTAPNETGFPGGTIVLGAHDALSTTARIVWPNANNNIAGGTIDLAGHSQTVAGLEKPFARADFAPNSIPNITNTSESADSTLTLAGLSASYTYTGRITDGPTRKLALVVDCPGFVQTLAGAPGQLTYSGDTTIRGGTLSVTNPSFAAASTLTIGENPDNGAVLDLPNAGSSIVAALVIDGVAAPAGIHGAIGSGVQFETNAITGLGTIQVGGAVSDYDAWVALQQPGFTASQPTDDPDGDGLTNAVEHAFGLDPQSGASVSPVSTGLSSGKEFIYTRRATSGLTYKVFTSTDLAAWAEDSGAVQTLGTTDENGVQSVTVTLSSTPVNGKIFARIQAE